MKNHWFLLLLETTSDNTLDSQLHNSHGKNMGAGLSLTSWPWYWRAVWLYAEHSAGYFESMNFKWMKFRSELHDGTLNHVTWALINALRHYQCSMCQLHTCSWINKCCPAQEKMPEDICEYRIRQLLLWQQTTSNLQWHVVTSTFHFPESFTLHCRFTKDPAIDII